MAHKLSVTADFSNNSVDFYSDKIHLEYKQSIEEGRDILQYKELFEAVANMPRSAEKEKIADILHDIVLNAEIAENYAYNEPSELEEIKKLRKAYDFEIHENTPDELKSKISGAWLGRICGCLLGKPVECIRTDELISLLKETNNYPMSRYILSSDITEEMCNRYRFGLRNKCWADTVDGAPIDDDTNYTVMAQYIVEKYGRDFTPADVGKTWLAIQPRDNYFTAERVAFVNLVNGYLPPDTAVYKNPFREWIGAQIRGDYFGYINPGNPELAAEMAWRDASVSHVKNGIYGEMFVAAMIACAAVADNIKDVICGGLAQVPQTSRLYSEVTEVISCFESGKSSEECYALIHSKYDEHTDDGWCHTLSNAMIVVVSLLYGDGDYGKTVCLAVQTGFDTDCNAATAGSVFGMLHGEKAIGEEWTKVINNKVNTSLLGIGAVSVDELVDKTIKHI